MRRRGRQQGAQCPSRARAPQEAGCLGVWPGPRAPLFQKDVQDTHDTGERQQVTGEASWTGPREPQKAQEKLPHPRGTGCLSAPWGRGIPRAD